MIDLQRQVPGSVIGGILLIAGSCIGAGMLALPILTGLAGFFPSLIAILAACVFMTFTGLLLVEVNGWFYGSINLLSMTELSFGKPGKALAWVSYLFLFYALLVAYSAASGEVFAAILQELLGWNVPGWTASIVFTLLFGWIIYLGTHTVDVVNRILMIGLIVAYLGMIGLGLSKIDPALLLHYAPHRTLASLPVLVVSFGFQNMIPSLTTYMKGDLKRVRWTILGGSALALSIYLLWTALVLGVVPVDGINGILATYERGEEATAALRWSLGSSQVAFFAQSFAFFAIVTSFLAQGLSLTHFLADGFKKEPVPQNIRWLCLLALIPPLIFALLSPQMFFRALSFAGGVCAMILFGLLPIGMAWTGRYKKKQTSSYHVRGGKPALILGLLFTLTIISCELIRIFS